LNCSPTGPDGTYLMPVAGFQQAHGQDEHYSSNSDDGYGIEEENGDQYDADSEEFQKPYDTIDVKEQVEQDDVNDFFAAEFEFQARLNGDFDRQEGRFLAPTEEENNVFEYLHEAIIPRSLQETNIRDQVIEKIEKFLAVLYEEKNLDEEIRRPFEALLSRLYNEDI